MNKIPHSVKIIAVAAGLAIGASPGVALSKTLNFAGYVWTVRSGGYGSPGVMYWSENNAFVDQNGALHLKMTYQNGRWYCAEVTTTTQFGMGTYQFYTDSRVDTLDKNLVLGLFSYPTANVGVSGTHEIDIEFAKWGNAAANILDYTVWPVVKALRPTGRTYPLKLSGNWSTHRYIRSSRWVRFQSVYGHYDNNPYPIADWTYQPTDYAQRISQSPMPVHINLWGIAPPSNGQPVEVIISSFKYKP